MILRPGIQSLLQDVQAGRFDAVLAEALDRASRDQADVATLFKHLQFAGLKIVTLAEGEISELHVGLKGTMNALFPKDLAKKTRRPKSLLSGLVVCGWREGPFTLRGQGRFACSNHIDTRTCSNGQTIARDKLEGRMLESLRDRLMAPEVAAEAIRAHVEKTDRINHQRRAASTANHPAERDETADAIRGLIETVTLLPGTKRGEFGAILECRYRWVRGQD